MKKLSILLLSFFLLLGLMNSSIVLAQETEPTTVVEPLVEVTAMEDAVNPDLLAEEPADIPTVYDWYIYELQAEYLINKDSSVTVTEWITADCGECYNRHGIYRVLPYTINTTDQGTIKTPVELISITDFDDKPHMYETISDRFNKTVSWKIGDPNKTVQGLNYYKIKYNVKNAVRTENPEFDEFFWNIHGQYWELETVYFTGWISFPEEVKQKDVEIEVYTGSYGDKGGELVDYFWDNEGYLVFTNEITENFQPGEGVTVSTTFPKGIVTAYEPTFWEKFWPLFWPVLSLLIPIVAFVISFKVWKKYGDDPDFDKTVIAQYEPPKDLDPITAGMVEKEGSFSNHLVSAGIVDLAVKGFIKIEEIQKGKLIKSKDFKLIKLKDNDGSLTKPMEKLLVLLFDSKEEITISSLKNKFHKDVTVISELSKSELIDKGYFGEKGFSLKPGFIAVGIVLAFASFQVFPWMFTVATGMLAAGVIFFGFGWFMHKKTVKGAEVQWNLKGFKLYMDTAEKHRQQFYEKENIFEKFLPYAMVFGMTKQWVKKMQEIYGEEFFRTYHPAWYMGAGLASFDANSFSSSISKLSSSMAASSAKPSSGSGGGGFSGGGGGGGGGGGW
jgi:hypothetical protein